MAMPLVVAILGAESTGKTTLALELAEALRGRMVNEFLREFCDRERRTPRRDEQRSIADEQMRRIAAAAAEAPVVIADTSALQTAVYSELVFGDRSLYDDALAAHAAGVGLTLLTALDLPWESDGLQRDGPHVREPVDRLLRSALARHGIAHAVVAGTGAARLQAARSAIQRHLAGPARHAPRWQWVCERCGEPGCERHLLARDLGSG
jgi:nicotinamide riboside kinase